MFRRNVRWTFRRNTYAIDVPGFQGAEPSGKFRNSPKAVSGAEWLATLRNLPVISPPLNTAGSCDKSNRRLEDSIGRGNRRTEKTEPDVCGYPLSAPGSYDKYQHTLSLHDALPISLINLLPIYTKTLCLLIKNEKSGKERRQKPMRKRNHTVTIRMNKAEYELLQSKVKESGSIFLVLPLPL